MTLLGSDQRQVVPSCCLLLGSVCCKHRTAVAVGLVGSRMLCWHKTAVIYHSHTHQIPGAKPHVAVQRPEQRQKSHKRSASQQTQACQRPKTPTREHRLIMVDQAYNYFNSTHNSNQLSTAGKLSSQARLLHRKLRPILMDYDLNRSGSRDNAATKES